MNDVTIPGWVIWVLIGSILPWLIWLTKDSYKNKQDIAVNTANDLKHAEDLEKVYRTIQQSEGRLKESFKRLEERVDTLIANEMTILKEIVSKK